MFQCGCIQIKVSESLSLLKSMFDVVAHCCGYFWSKRFKSILYTFVRVDSKQTQTFSKREFYANLGACITEMLIRNKFAVFNQDFIEWRELKKNHTLRN